MSNATGDERGEVVEWVGRQFQVWTRDVWPAVAGLFIFAAPDRNCETGWRPIFVGDTDYLNRDVPRHPQWAAAVEMGATHVHVQPATAPDLRRLARDQLIRELRPRLNLAAGTTRRGSSLGPSGS